MGRKKSVFKLFKKNSSPSNLFLILILTLAVFLRTLNINWDQGLLMHPDERMLLMVSGRVHLFSSLDPDFFNYGTLPIYILKAFAQILQPLLSINLSDLSHLSILGRALSTTADIMTIILIYKISLILFSKILKKESAHRFALIPAFIYTLLFFPIQNSHFFIVDTFLTFFTTLLFYLLLNLQDDKKKMPLQLAVLGIVSAAILTTKVSGVIFVSAAGAYIFYKLLKTYAAKRVFSKKSLSQVLRYFFIFYLGIAFISSFAFMPYAFLKFPRFLSDVVSQVRMNSDPYTFPYTLQYVDTPAYLYHLRNIFFWGAGPLTTSLAIIGLGALAYILYKRKLLPAKEKPLMILFLGFYLLYFLIIGKSAVKFMRYMLPLYPFLSILAVFPFVLCRKYEKHIYTYPAALLIVFIQFIYLLPFLQIYLQENTRIQATRWILANIPPQSTLAVEHWDDRLPAVGQDMYKFEELQIYNQPDDKAKWIMIENQLASSDYLIIASNRLYAPVQRLYDCRRYKVCYPIASEYYTQLLTTGVVFLPSQIIRFEKVAEFTVQPELNIPFFNLKLKIPDQQADESFSVYDHPRILIFKKTLE